MRKGYLHADIANACHRLVRQFIVCQQKPYAKTLCPGVQKFLQNYRLIRPLFREDEMLIPIFFREVLLLKLCNALKHYLDGAYSQDAAHEQITRFLGLLDEAVLLTQCFATDRTQSTS